MPDFLNGLFFSEILADNAGGGAVNVNGQGGANKQDEFVELQNNSGSSVDLNGYQIWSAKNGLLHAFGTGDQISAGGTATVVGTYNNPPAGFYGASGNNNSAGSNGGFLEDGEGNKFDTIYLVAPDGNYIRLSYGQSPQVPATLPTGFPTGGALQGVGEIIASDAPNSTSLLRDANGDLVEGAPTPGTTGPVCFVSGTLISTDQGEVAVDDLIPGMRVLSSDKGYVPLRAIRRSPISKAVLRSNPSARAVVVPQGVLGNSAPLRLSPAHRNLVFGPKVELLFSVPEVLVSARQLVGHGGIHVDHSDRHVTYFHLLFDQHEIIRSDGCWSESLFLGDVAQAAVLTAIGWQFEPGCDLDQMMHDTTARLTLKSYEASMLLCELGNAELNKVAA